MSAKLKSSILVALSGISAFLLVLKFPRGDLTSGIEEPPNTKAPKMRHEHKSTLAEILTAKRDNLRLISIAVVVAVAVGVLSSALSSALAKYSALLISSSIAIILVALFMLGRDLTRKLRFEDDIEAIIFFNRDTGDLIDVPGYKFAQEFCKTLKAVGAENRAIHSEWTNSSLIPKREKPQPKESSDDNGDSAEDKRAVSKKTTWIAVSKVDPTELETPMIPESTKLLSEVSEYISLELLSLHLSTYFNDKDEDELIRELNRKDIPEFLLENRVLNLLSTPIEERDIFLDAFPNQGMRPKGEIYSLYGSNGAVYSRFDLVLPDGSTLERSNHGGFRVKTSRFFVEISTRYDGFSANPPRGFIELMLGKDFQSIEAKKVLITVRGKFELISLFRNVGWEYYEWLDSFRTKIHSAFDFSSYCEQINWNIVEPMFRVGIPFYRRIERGRKNKMTSE